MRYDCVDPLNVVRQLLLKHVASSQDHILQEAAASCLSNVRHVGLLSDKLQSGTKKQNPYIIHPES